MTRLGAQFMSDKLAKEMLVCLFAYVLTDKTHSHTVGNTLVGSDYSP